jgi:hypothetical protein
MNGPRDDDPWIGRAKALLDESARNLDGSALSRLNRARQAALAEPRSRFRPWVFGAGIAGVAVAVFAVAIGLDHRTGVPAAPLQAADIDVLTSDGDDDTLDLSENLDFYAWLDAQPSDKNG